MIVIGGETVVLGIYAKHTIPGEAPTMQIQDVCTLTPRELYICEENDSHVEDRYEEGEVYQCSDCGYIVAIKEWEGAPDCTNCDYDSGMDRIDGEGGTEPGRYCYICDRGRVTKRYYFSCPFESCDPYENGKERFDSVPDLMGHIITHMN